MRMDSVEIDATCGGKWKYVFRGHGETPMSFSGVFHTVQPNVLIIQTVEFNMAPGQVGLSSTAFTDLQGRRTRIAIREVYPSVEARDAALASGMNEGINEGYERLDELLAA